MLALPAVIFTRK